MGPSFGGPALYLKGLWPTRDQIALPERQRPAFVEFPLTCLLTNSQRNCWVLTNSGCIYSKLLSSSQPRVGTDVEYLERWHPSGKRVSVGPEEAQPLPHSSRHPCICFCPSSSLSLFFFKLWTFLYSFPNKLICLINRKSHGVALTLSLLLWHRAITLENQLVILAAAASDSGPYYVQAVNERNGENKTSPLIYLSVASEFWNSQYFWKQ